MLPEQFVERMKRMLGDEYEEFAKTYDEEQTRYHALRLNPGKTTTEKFMEKSPFTLSPVPWEKHGFYYDKEDTPGRHPYHAAGVYYIQEPSAMAPGAYLDAQPGEYVLDLCAAPGGKSTQIAAAMQGKGILISNEIVSSRAKILSENIERMGIVNCMVTNESPDKLAKVFPAYFDRIMVDAPCSGEGMFRKNDNASDEWSLDNVKLCAERQLEILEHAQNMLRAGGRIVYSTCTFAPEENEGTISRFLAEHEDFVIEEVHSYPGMRRGEAAWTTNAAEGIEHTLRLFPHRLHGEGHYVAVLKKKGELDVSYHPQSRNGCVRGISEKECGEYLAFCKETLKIQPEGTLIRFGDQLYLAPQELPDTKGLKVLRPGLHLGTMKKNRFEPSHALALALRPEDVRHVAELTADGTEIRAYLNGQTLNMDGEKGWYLVCVDGYSTGWGKLAGTILKNHYPKGLRIPY